MILMRHLAKVFNIESMSEEALLPLYMMAQAEADRCDRMGNPTGCRTFSELWCDIEDLLETRRKKA
jgi:hypothetical protein